MQYKIFSIPVPSKSGSENALNSFLRSHKIINIKEYLVTSKEQPYLLFSVEYIANSQDVKTERKNQIDYKEVLSQADYALFNKLREIRKQIADEKGYPVYAVFTNDQLLQIIKTKVSTVSALEKINGIGKGKIDKFSQPLLDFLKEQFGPDNETSG